MTKKRLKTKKKGLRLNLLTKKQLKTKKRSSPQLADQKAIGHQKISMIWRGFRAPRTEGKQSVLAQRRVKVQI